MNSMTQARMEQIICEAEWVISWVRQAAAFDLPAHRERCERMRDAHVRNLLRLCGLNENKEEKNEGNTTDNA